MTALPNAPLPFLKRTAFRAALAGLALLGGCAGSRQDVTFTPVATHQTYRQEFGKAYARHDSAGNIDVVVLDARPTASRAPGPVRQLLHVRVLWTPTREQKAVTNNAALTWYVVDRNNPRDVLTYAGTGFASLNSDDNDGRTTLTIQNALLKPSPSQSSGFLRDPVGPFTLEATIRATDDAARVTQHLAELQGEAAGQDDAAPR